MRFKTEYLELYAITGRGDRSMSEFLDGVKAALEGGITMLQLREKGREISEILETASFLLPLCKAYGVPLIINDSLETALEAGADGVHLGEGDGDPGDARKAAGQNFIIGATCKRPERAVLLEKAGVDYLGSGAIFTSATKPGALHISFETLKNICKASSLPVAAIGGIGPENIRDLRGSGIKGAAISSGIFSADDVKARCVLLKEILKAEVLNDGKEA